MADIVQLIWAIVISMLPVTELRLGLPLAIGYAIKSNVPIWLVFFVILLANILVIFLVFLFLDYAHKHLVKIRFYERAFGFLLKRTQRKVDKIEKKMGIYGYIALAVFVGIPLPATGAWTGCLIAWILGLNRKKSILAISLGVLIAGILILAGTLGVIKIFDLS